MTYKAYGLATLHEFLGDNVAYRNLVPADSRLPSVSDLRHSLGLEEGVLPRKSEPTYGRVVVEILRRAREIEAPGVGIARLLYIGDTQLNDGTAFGNIRAAGRWPGWAFIGRDALSSPSEVKAEGSLYVANRWSALPDFLSYVEDEGFALDERTAAVIDIDKTAIGARGRNDHVIDAARVEGVRRTVADLLGSSYDQEAFQRAYGELNQTIYHPFTTDNQDYLAYICLMLGAGLFALEDVVREVQAGSLANFRDFISRVQARRTELDGSGLTPIHDDVWGCVQAGDPTPFKAFRYNEYLTTVARFGDLPGAGVEELLDRRIVLTQEVCEAALALRERGVLLFGVSDKPDEASLPSERQAREGMVALHHLETVTVGRIG
jgi:catechol 2,3-dioxygenase-like lactoylglutathione lyase family enzyme